MGFAFNAHMFDSAWALRIGSLLVLTSLLGACDPAAPGAAGHLSLAPSVDPAKFAVLEVRAYPDATGSFDPDKIPVDSDRSSEKLKGLHFPYAYRVGGGGIGKTEVRQWRMTAWLSATEGTQRPGANDPQCTVSFFIGDCGGFAGDYCEVTDDVDCTLK